MGLLDGAEVAKHNSTKSCWIVINSNVYDVTSFLNEHPGGAAVLLQNAGADATPEFNKYHSPEIVNDLPKEFHLGALDSTTASHLSQPKSASLKPSNTTGTASPTKLPPSSLCVSITDFEPLAKLVLSPKSWIYAYSSASTGHALASNLSSWSQLHFRPRIMRNVEHVSLRTRILGVPSAFPFFVAPMGTLGSVHGGAEPELVRGIVRGGMHGVLSTASTRRPEDIVAAFDAAQAEVGSASPARLFFQLYVHSEREKAVELLRKVKRLGFKGLWITVDTPVVGKRTADRRLQAEEALAAGVSEAHAEEARKALSENKFSPAFGGRPMPGQLTPCLSWEFLKWIREEWDGPIVLKGIQCAEDAKLAMEHGCQGILLSNHGGRQLHSAPSALMTLMEIRTYCPDVLGKMEIFLDGGLRDGADVLKALCLGATAVGIGRPFLYALATYGAEGVERCIEILSQDMTTAMRLLGVTSLDQVRPEMVNASKILNEMWRPEKTAKLSRL